MAKRNFLVDLDLNQNELLKARIENLAAAPGTPVIGQIYFDTVKDQIGVYTSGGWSYGGDITNVLGDAPSGIQVSVDGNGVATVSLLAATGSQNGYMSSSDKTKLDAATASSTPDTLMYRDSSGNTAIDTIIINDAPTAANHGVNKAYVDGLVQGLDIKPSVRAIATTNVASLSGPQTVDTVSLVAGDRVLLTSQTTTSQDGIYVVAAGAWTRALDFQLGAGVANAFVFVEEGSAAYVDTGWVCTNNVGSDIVGTNDLIFVQFSSAGVIDAGAGLTKTGNNIDVVAGDDSLTVNANDVVVKRDAAGAVGLTAAGVKVNTDTNFITISSNNVTVGDYTAKTGFATVTLGTVAGAQVITHNLNTRNLQVSVFNASTFAKVTVSVTHTSLNTITVSANGVNTSHIVVITGNVGQSF